MSKKTKMREQRDRRRKEKTRLMKKERREKLSRVPVLVLSTASEEGVYVSGKEQPNGTGVSESTDSIKDSIPPEVVVTDR